MDNPPSSASVQPPFRGLRTNGSRSGPQGGCTTNPGTKDFKAWMVRTKPQQKIGESWPFFCCGRWLLNRGDTGWSLVIVLLV